VAGFGVTETMTDDVLFVINELVPLVEVRLVVLLVALFGVTVVVPFELCGKGSIEKAYCGKIKSAKNEKNTRDLAFM
jgi:hypothetical protein